MIETREPLSFNPNIGKNDAHFVRKNLEQIESGLNDGLTKKYIYEFLVISHYITSTYQNFVKILNNIQKTKKVTQKNNETDLKTVLLEDIHQELMAINSKLELVFSFIFEKD